MDYRTFYHLECHLELTVKARFHEDGELGAFDFFCIVIWKAIWVTMSTGRGQLVPELAVRVGCAASCVSAADTTAISPGA